MVRGGDPGVKRMVGFGHHRDSEHPGPPHGWLFMGWFHEGLANGCGEMALEESQISEVHGTMWE